MTALQDLRLPFREHSLGFFVFENEITSNKYAINLEKAFDYAHQGVGHN